MSGFLTWQALVLLIIGVMFGSTIKGFVNKAKAKV